MILQFIIIVNLGVIYEEFISNLKHIMINCYFVYWLLYIKKGNYIYRYITNNYYSLIFLIMIQFGDIFCTSWLLLLFFKSSYINLLCLGVISWSEPLFHYISTGW